MAYEEKFMLDALKEADKAPAEHEVPVGAVVVCEGKIIARAHNRRENKQSATAHAELLAIEKACKLITEDELGRLWVAAKEFEKTKAEGNLVRLAETDVAFHEIIYQASDNKRLNQVLNNLREQMYRYRVEYLKDEQTRNLLVSEHEELVKAIREGDVQKAQDISFHHLENQRKAIIRTIRAENEAKEAEKKE